MPGRMAGPMFETFAVVSTIAMVVIFVLLYRTELAGRREESEKAQGPTEPRP
jgi:hypothetical protein